MKPWGNQETNLKGADKIIPSISKFAEKLDSIIKPEDKMLVGLCYLSGGRISELIRSDRYGRHMESIKRKQIDHEDLDGRRAVKITIRNLKKHDNKNAFKTIALPLDIESNKIIFDMIWIYIKDMDQEQELFPFCYTKAYNIIKKSTGWNPHWIRHLRTTHLLTHFDFKDEAIRMYMGWGDSRPLKSYSEFKWMDVFREFHKNDK